MSKIKVIHFTIANSGGGITKYILRLWKYIDRSKFQIDFVTMSKTLDFAEELEKEGINIRVVDIHTIKPIDKDIIIKCAKETKKLISIEEHSIIGGLGSAIAEVLVENYPAKLTRMGMKDCFGKSGKAQELLEYFGLTSKEIIEEVRK